MSIQIIGFTKYNYTFSYKSLDLLSKANHLSLNHYIYYVKAYISIQTIGCTKQAHTFLYKSLDLLSKTI